MVCRQAIGLGLGLVVGLGLGCRTVLRCGGLAHVRSQVIILALVVVLVLGSLL